MIRERCTCMKITKHNGHAILLLDLVGDNEPSSISCFSSIMASWDVFWYSSLCSS